jgi:hypothetical protein
MKKKELLGKIEELESEVAYLNARITALEESKPAVIYPITPEPQKLPINPWDTWKDVPICPPFIVYC